MFSKQLACRGIKQANILFPFLNFEIIYWEEVRWLWVGA